MFHSFNRFIVEKILTKNINSINESFIDEQEDFAKKLKVGDEIRILDNSIKGKQKKNTPYYVGEITDISKNNKWVIKLDIKEVKYWPTMNKQMKQIGRVSIVIPNSDYKLEMASENAPAAASRSKVNYPSSGAIRDALDSKALSFVHSNIKKTHKFGGDVAMTIKGGKKAPEVHVGEKGKSLSVLKFNNGFWLVKSDAHNFNKEVITDQEFKKFLEKLFK